MRIQELEAAPARKSKAAEVSVGEQVSSSKKAKLHAQESRIEKIDNSRSNELEESLLNGRDASAKAVRQDSSLPKDWSAFSSLTPLPALVISDRIGVNKNGDSLFKCPCRLGEGCLNPTGVVKRDKYLMPVKYAEKFLQLTLTSIQITAVTGCGFTTKNVRFYREPSRICPKTGVCLGDLVELILPKGERFNLCIDHRIHPADLGRADIEQYIEERTGKHIRSLENQRDYKRAKVAAMSEEEYRVFLDAQNEISRRRHEQRVEMGTIIPFSGEGETPNGGWLEEHNVPGIIN